MKMFAVCCMRSIKTSQLHAYGYTRVEKLELHMTVTACLTMMNPLVLRVAPKCVEEQYSPVPGVDRAVGCQTYAPAGVVHGGGTLHSSGCLRVGLRHS